MREFSMERKLYITQKTVSSNLTPAAKFINYEFKDRSIN